MVERFAARYSGLHVNAQAVLYLLLAEIIRQCRRAQRTVCVRVLHAKTRADQAIVFHVFLPFLSLATIAFRYAPRRNTFQISRNWRTFSA